jgi:hypothetical protein
MRRAKPGGIKNGFKVDKENILRQFEVIKIVSRSFITITLMLRRILE